MATAQMPLLVRPNQNPLGPNPLQMLPHPNLLSQDAVRLLDDFINGYDNFWG